MFIFLFVLVVNLGPTLAPQDACLHAGFFAHMGMKHWTGAVLEHKEMSAMRDRIIKCKADFSLDN